MKMDNFEMSPGEIKARLKKAGKTMNDLAEFAGMPVPSISKQLAGKLNIRKKDMIVIDAFFKAINSDLDIYIDPKNQLTRTMHDDSMLPLIPNKYLLFLQQSKLGSSLSDLYYIEMKDKSKVVGRIRAKGDQVTVIPENSEFEDIKIDKKNIVNSYKILAAKIVFD